MVMRWKILEVAKSANSLKALLLEVRALPAADISDYEICLLLQEYSALLPMEISTELKDYLGKTENGPKA